MKKVAILTLCLLVAGCGNNSVSVLGSPESDGSAGLRLGTEVAENVEVGVSAYFNPWDGETKKTYSSINASGQSYRTENPDSRFYGIYALYDIPVMNDLTAYVGAEAQVGEGTWDIVDTIEPFGGVRLWDLVFVEFHPNTIDGEDNKILGGVTYRF